MNFDQAALIVEMFERGYSKEQIVLATGIPPFLVSEILRADRTRLTTLLHIIALRQRGTPFQIIVQQCKITAKTLDRWLTRARQAGVSFPEGKDGGLDPRRVASFGAVLGVMPSSTTFTASTGTTQTRSPPS